jgi:acylphosphatase
VSKSAVHVRLSGRVQGVGFRWYCVQRANGLGVTGWVKNRGDGSVEVLAEGDRSELEDFVRQLEQGPGSAHVADADVDWHEYTGKYNSFEVAF